MNARLSQQSLPGRGARCMAFGKCYLIYLLVGGVLSYFHFTDGLSDLSKVACWERQSSHSTAPVGL